MSGIVVLIIVWSFLIKGVALWHAGTNKQFGWFVVLYMVHTAGILDMIYLLWFRPRDGQQVA